ncbi:MAG: hypothetical protein ABIL11_03900 [Chloroflexota bacterium]
MEVKGLTRPAGPVRPDLCEAEPGSDLDRVRQRFVAAPKAYSAGIPEEGQKDWQPTESCVSHGCSPQMRTIPSSPTLRFTRAAVK